MARKEVRNSTSTNSSTDTVKGSNAGSVHRGTTRAAPMSIKTPERRDKNIYEITPPATMSSRTATSTSNGSNVSPRDQRVSSFGNYRRDLSVLETSGRRVPDIQHTLPSAVSSPDHVAPWLNASPSPALPSATFGTSFYNDSSDNLSQASQLSPGFRPGSGRAAALDSPDTGYFGDGDERRPSVASVTTASSSGSKSSSMLRSGAHTYKKLQGFFGEEAPGKDEPPSSEPPGRGQRSNSYTRFHRDRDRNNSISTEVRDASPVPSRPRTPVPSADVVPFLYQDLEDISLYGEAPVRDTLSGPDRERYIQDDPPTVPPKTSSSSRSGHSQRVHLPGHGHRHNRSTDDAGPVRPGTRRENSVTSIHKAVAMSKMAPSTQPGSSSSRSKSPAPSAQSDHSQSTTASVLPQSPAHAKRNGHGMLNIFRRHKDKDDHHHSPLTKHFQGSARSLHRSDSKEGLQSSPDLMGWNEKGGSVSGSEVNLLLPRIENGQFGGPRPSVSRQGSTFKTLPFGRRKTGLRSKEDNDQLIDPLDSLRRPSVAARANNGVFDLDTDITNMEGILARPVPMTPLDNSIFTGNVEDEAKVEAEAVFGTLGWNAPDSWAVKKVNDDNMSRLPEIDEAGTAPKYDEKTPPYCLRVFRGDGTFGTLSMPLNATVTEVIHQFGRKTYTADNLVNYQIIMKKHDLQRILGGGERPIVIQKRLLEQAGYEEQDKLEDVGREDNSYLCRFMFVPTRDNPYAGMATDPGLSKVQKFSHVDLSGRNLITIPITLYSKAHEIISLNLSRNLSLDLPKDFVQSCLNLRDIKYINNEAWKLPPSISAASRLTILDVSNNRLEQLEHAELEKLHGLISLKLANNRLTHLPDYFGAFRSMRTLNLSSNFLDIFPVFLCNLEGLVDLDMSFNSIATLPDEIGNLKSLERFVITNNRLKKSLPDNFKQLRNLREVDIRYNALSSIDIISKLPKVEMLSADHNSISVFEGEFDKIRILRLNSNPVTKFEILNYVPTLTTLILSNAKLATMPDSTFDRMPNLVKLSLDNNHFVSLPSHIGKLRNLEDFSIARNSLNSLPPEIGCLTELRTLDVRQNNLKKLPVEIWWANKLETLNLSSNVLVDFPKPGSRAPQVPGEVVTPQTLTDKAISSSLYTARSPSSSLAESPEDEEIGPLEGFGQRRPSQASGGLLSVGTSPVPGPADRKPSVVSLYGKGGRQTSVVSRNTSQSTVGTMTPPSSSRKDSSLSAKLQQTFAGSLKNLSLADNQLDDDVFDEITLLGELRVLNLSYNVLNDMPQRSIRSWPQLEQLYLSGNELTSLPADDFEEISLLQILHINSNKFQTLPAELGKAHRLAVLDCGSNSLKYNVSNWPYDWNWNWNTALKYLNLSGNKRLEIKPNLTYGAGNAGRDGRDLTNFNTLQHLRILGLMDVTLTLSTIPDETEDRRVRTSGSLAGHLAYGMADSLGQNQHLSTIDMVVPRFNSSESETLMGMFDGQALSSGGSKIAKYLHENFGPIFSEQLRALNTAAGETPEDALRRTFLSLNKDLATAAMQHMEERSLLSHRGSAAPAVLTQSDLHSGGVATVLFLQQMELYVANVGDAQAMLIQSDGGHRMLTRKHDPAEPNERQRIRDAGGWVSRQGKLNDILDVSRAFGYVQLMPAVQAAPHVAHTTLREQDELIIVASKELWEFLPPGLVVDMARTERLDLMRAAQKLRDLAIAYGATGKIMVMILGVSDLKKRERNRLNRGTSMSMGPSGLADDNYVKRPKRGKGESVEDSGLRRLEAEVQAPVGDISIVFTDIKSSTSLWENHPQAMRSAIRLHNEVMRRQLRIIGGYEVKTEGDAFIVSFSTATAALLWCFSIQAALLEIQWPAEVLDNPVGREVHDSDGNLIFRGLSVRMGIHFGAPVCEIDPVTRRMDYFGPMVNKTARISSVADGGQITVSTDFISEIQRCLETFSETDRSDSAGSEEQFDNDLLSHSIRRELRSLSSQGFEVKDMGERKLKGLENAEYIYLMYPHSLSGRIDAQPLLGTDLKEKPSGDDGAVTNSNLSGPPQLENSPFSNNSTELGLLTDQVWQFWALSLRLEMVCEKLEIGGPLCAPEYGMMETMKTKGGQVTDTFLVNFLRHLTLRIEACINMIHARHVIQSAVATTVDANPVFDLNALGMPMVDMMQHIKNMALELKAYRSIHGEIMPERICEQQAQAVIVEEE